MDDAKRSTGQKKKCHINAEPSFPKRTSSLHSVLQPVIEARSFLSNNAFPIQVSNASSDSATKKDERRDRMVSKFACAEARCSRGGRRQEGYEQGRGGEATNLGGPR